ncbi:MAG TPA: phosphotransferase [Nevskia sp.]|jgi:aminoglycoside/choline kinase family phosphotransferase|nr:phosphotransferase [Nevskia sp.]
MIDNDSLDRTHARGAFLTQTGLADATLEPLPVDASFRRYFRLRGAGRPMLLMDAPPPKEDVRPFIRIARHLTGLGLSAPEIYEFDEAEGFALIEDFGEATYTNLLDAGAAEGPLFHAATEALVTLHTSPDGAAVEALPYDRAKLLDEASELPEWYGLALTSRPLEGDAIATFTGLWGDLLDRLPPTEPALVLLDYHVDNLMQLPGRQGAAACGLLDFQDARIGPRPYDLMTLLRNERRGIDPALSDALYDYYIAAVRPADADGFGLWYRVLAAQRYTKVLGRFARLTLRDSRDGYLRYLPRFAALLTEALDQEPLLAPIHAHLNAILPDWQRVPPDDPVGLRRRVASAASRS